MTTFLCALLERHSGKCNPVTEIGEAGWGRVGSRKTWTRSRYHIPNCWYRSEGLQKKVDFVFTKTDSRLTLWRSSSCKLWNVDDGDVKSCVQIGLPGDVNLIILLLFRSKVRKDQCACCWSWLNWQPGDVADYRFHTVWQNSKSEIILDLFALNAPCSSITPTLNKPPYCSLEDGVSWYTISHSAECLTFCWINHLFFSLSWISCKAEKPNRSDCCVLSFDKLWFLFQLLKWFLLFFIHKRKYLFYSLRVIVCAQINAWCWRAHSCISIFLDWFDSLICILMSESVKEH